MKWMKKNKKQEPEVLLSSASPICPLEALVEDDGDCVYFYIYGQVNQEPFMRSCWVLNRTAAPPSPDQKAMEAGRAPRLSRPYCDHPQGMEVPEGLEIIWLKAGSEAALLAAGQLLAYIPDWAESQQMFPGYSRHCLDCNPLAWPLGAEAEKNILPRIEAAKVWQTYLQGNFWQEFQPAYLSVAEEFFGAHERYFGIDGGAFPPKALVTGRRDQTCYAVTLGISLFQMPKTEPNPEEPEPPARRIELAFAWQAGSLGAQGENEMTMLSYLSGIANIPWQNLTFLGNGHTIPCESIPGFAAVLLQKSEAEDSLQFPDFQEDKVETLWLIPLTAEELTLAMAEGSQALVAKAGAENGTELTVFSGQAKFLG